MFSCQSCAVAIQNDDTSHINADDLDTVVTNIESLGMVTVSEIDENGYFYCGICDQNTLGAQYQIEEI